MSNEQFDDIAVLTTLAQLHKRDLLSEADLEALAEQLKTDWGRQVFEDLKSESGPKPEDKSLLARYSTVFAA